MKIGERVGAYLLIVAWALEPFAGVIELVVFVLVVTALALTIGGHHAYDVDFPGP